MADLVKNNNIGNAGISFTTSELKVGLGNKILIDAGSVNTIVLGTWNRLMGCVSTDIQLGTVAEIIMANSTSIIFGDSWNYLSDSQTIATDSDSKIAYCQLLLAAGMSGQTKATVTSERAKANKVLLAVITSYLLILGISLVSIQYPPFVNTIDESNESGYEVSSPGIYLTLFDLFSMIGIFLAQFFYIKKISNTPTYINAVSNLSLAANGIMAAVFANADEQPQLIDFNNQISDPDCYTSNNSPAAIFNILPGLPQNQESVEPYKHPESSLMNITLDNSLSESSDSLPSTEEFTPLLNNNYYWKNPKNGLYPNHDNTPIITLASQLVPYKEVEQFGKIIIKPNVTYRESTVNITPDTIHINSHSVANILDITLGCNENNSAVEIINFNEKNDIASICIDNEATRIFRNNGLETEISFINSPISNLSAPTVDDVHSIHEYSNHTIEHASINLLAHEASISISTSVANEGCNKSGLFINRKNISITTNNKTVATFNRNIIKIGNMEQVNPNVVKISGLICKFHTRHTISTDNQSMFKAIDNERIQQIIQFIKNKKQLITSYRSNTGRFSGSINNINQKEQNDQLNYQ